MERKLASIQKIISIQEIPGAHSIDKATILGWECVVKKGEFSPGDSCVYFEIDSILPEKPEFEFMRNKKFRVKTARFQKQISQGLALPVSSFTYADLSPYKEGDDVTEVLQITKFDPEANIPAQLRGIARGNFPSFLKKTDETRIQSIPSFLENHKGETFYITEKCDGSSTTVFIKNNEFRVCSRNLELAKESVENSKDIKNTFWKTAFDMKLDEKLLSVNKDIGLQGEMLGPGIQKNKYGLDRTTILFYNVYDISTNKYYDYSDFVNFITSLELKTVPILREIVLNHTVKDIVEMSRGQSKLAKVHREGLVFRSVIEGYDHATGRLSFKAINPDFLLKYDE